MVKYRDQLGILIESNVGISNKDDQSQRYKVMAYYRNTINVYLYDRWIIQGYWAIMREAMRDKQGLRALLSLPDTI